MFKNVTKRFWKKPEQTCLMTPVCFSKLKECQILVAQNVLQGKRFDQVYWALLNTNIWRPRSDGHMSIYFLYLSLHRWRFQTVTMKQHLHPKYTAPSLVQMWPEESSWMNNPISFAAKRVICMIYESVYLYEVIWFLRYTVIKPVSVAPKQFPQSHFLKDMRLSCWMKPGLTWRDKL